MASPRELTPRERTVVVTAFVVHLLLLVWVVLWKLAPPGIGAAAFLPHPVKLVPFVASGDAGASAPAEVVANVALFVPFGAFLGLVAPSWRWVQVLLVVAASSVVLEVGQHLLSTGSFDLTDVITNTFGALLGLALLALARRTLGTRAPRVAARVLVAVTALGVVAAAVFVATPGHWTPQQDVIVPTPTPS